ncbi:hypothetical protein MTR62_15065 [Novosphingobium sp. 1949]|uniref:Uncharacterized protein n=1 Tax=Novosphingobium organovorum TaxID=2930092 RepID=A0ABT0BGW9_9SPHN|nr:hypothetical protein [Novosphingobium organovorum]MCJ2184004.1 hypothetical protein [Novosphingobium organovorum]
MFGRVRLWLERDSSLRESAWNVVIDARSIAIRDGFGQHRSLALGALERVVMTTHDSFPWRTHRILILYGREPDPIAFFPTEARGSDGFLLWLRAQHGFCARTLDEAMAARRVSRHEIYTRRTVRAVKVPPPAPLGESAPTGACVIRPPAAAASRPLPQPPQRPPARTSLR